MEKERVNWVDVSRFLGMFAIYLGHLGASNVGVSVTYVFYWHVALFFLLSGCMEAYSKDTKIGKVVLKKTKSILVPFVVFAFSDIFVECIKIGLDITVMKQMLFEVACGVVRNTFVQGISLWFLTCLFVMQIMFAIIRKIKNKVLILVVCTVIYTVYKLYILPCFAGGATDYFNIGSALHYVIYYAIGYVAFPGIMKLFELNTRLKKMLFMFSGIVSGVYASLLFWGKDLFAKLNYVPVVTLYVPIFRALVCIWFVFIVAKMLENVALFRAIGRDSLYLCGSERIIRLLLISFLSFLGISINISTPLVAYVYAFILVFLAYKILVPLFKKILYWINSFLTAF